MGLLEAPAASLTELPMTTERILTALRAVGKAG